MYRGLLRRPLLAMSSEREREREREKKKESDRRRAKPAWCRARTEREREREREDRESAPFVEARYDVIKHTFWVMRERMSRDFPPI